MKDDDMLIESSSVVFLLGAGASIEAKVPDTVSFVKEFVDQISDPNVRGATEEIVRALKEWRNPQEVDVELLLETLTKLDATEEEPLLEFYEKPEFKLKDYPANGEIAEELKNYIRKRGIVTESDIRYLDPLFDFGRLDIISLNYDTCIEQFCNTRKIRYEDGFDLYWNPSLLHNKTAVIRLFKLHGSVTWYRTDHGNYMKLPLRNVTTSVELIGGETAQGLILYPMQKLDYSGPTVELLVEAKRILESASCKVIVVAGYSFRDEQIRSMLWDAARINDNLIMVLIDPKAYDIYESHLCYYDADHKIPSSLGGRTICLPYDFSKILVHLRTTILNNFEDALAEQNAQLQKGVKGEKADWRQAAVLFSNCEFQTQATRLWQAVPEYDRDIDRLWLLSILFKLGISELVKGKRKNYYLTRFFGTLKSATSSGLRIDLTRIPFGLNVSFDSLSREDSFPPSYTLDKYLSLFEELDAFIRLREEWSLPIQQKRLHPFSNIIGVFTRYLEQLNRMKANSKLYAASRFRDKEAQSQFLGEVELLERTGNNHTALSRRILDLERSRLKAMFDKW